REMRGTRLCAGRPETASENARLLSELGEPLGQQPATADVLQVISSSPGELEPVFQAMLENATRICEAKFGTLLLFEDDELRLVAMHGAPGEFEELRRPRPKGASLRASPRRDKADCPRCRHRGRRAIRKLPAGQARGGALLRQRANAQGE